MNVQYAELQSRHSEHNLYKKEGEHCMTGNLEVFIRIGRRNQLTAEIFVLA